MREIPIPNIEEVVDNIQDFFIEEGRGASRYVIKDLVRLWSRAKYPIYEKMGHRLTVSASDLEVGKLSVAQNFLSVVADIGAAHRRKTSGNDFHEDISNMAYEMKFYFRSRKDIMDRILDNKAFETEYEIDLFMRRLLPFTPEEFEDTHGWLNQTRLTRQIGMVVRDILIAEEKNKPGDSAEDWDKIAYKRRRVVYQRWSDSFNIFLSEIKQTFSREEERMEFVLSIDPYDFITASFNQHNWSSCYSPDGSYAKSVFTLMTDASTMIAYVPSKRELFKPYAVEKNSKKMRAFVHYDWHLEKALVSKAYPSSFEGFAEGIAQTMVRNNMMYDYGVVDHVDLESLDIYHSYSYYSDLANMSSASMILSKDDYVNEDYLGTWEIGETVGCMECGDTESMYQEQDHDEDAFMAWACIDCTLGEDSFTCPRCEERFCGEDIADGDYDIAHCRYCEDDFQDYGIDITDFGCDCDLCHDRTVEHQDRLDEEAEAEDRRREEREEQELEEQRLLAL